MQGKKTGGRVVGSTNKVGAEIKEVFSTIVGDYMTDKWKEDFESMTAETRAKLVLKMAEFVVPKEKEVNLSVSERRQLVGGAMGDLSRMTMEQQIKARPDLFQMLIEKAKAIQEANDAENI
jgi:hypothetical protein